MEERKQTWPGLYWLAAIIVGFQTVRYLAVYGFTLVSPDFLFTANAIFSMLLALFVFRIMRSRLFAPKHRKAFTYLRGLSLLLLALPLYAISLYLIEFGFQLIVPDAEFVGGTLNRMMIMTAIFASLSTKPIRKSMEPSNG